MSAFGITLLNSVAINSYLPTKQNFHQPRIQPVAQCSGPEELPYNHGMDAYRRDYVPIVENCANSERIVGKTQQTYNYQSQTAFSLFGLPPFEGEEDCYVRSDKRLNVENSTVEEASISETCIFETKNVESISNNEIVDCLGYEILDTMKRQEQRQLITHKVDTSKAWYLELRAELVCWVIDACEKFDLRLTTTDLAVVYMDRILCSRQIPEDSTKLVALISVIIAAKFEEEEEVVPKLSDFCSYAHNKYSEDFVRVMESEILKELSWNLAATTSAHFLEIFFESTECSAGLSNGQLEVAMRAHMQSTASYLHCLCLQDMSLLADYTPSELASAMLLACRTRLDADTLWTDALEGLTGYNESRLSPCAGRILRLLLENSTSLSSSCADVECETSGASHSQTESTAPAIFCEPSTGRVFSYLEFSPFMGSFSYPFSHHVNGYV